MTTIPTNFVCPVCNRICKSKGGLTKHRRSAHPNYQPIQTQQTQERQESVISSRILTPNPKPFTQEIDWKSLNIAEETYFDCCVNVPQGVIDLFVYLHNQTNYDNIRWQNNELYVYDDNQWCEATDYMLGKHLEYIFCILEEHWCDYQSSLRCGCTAIIESERSHEIDVFYYDQIVDSNSLLFYCKEMLFEYLETLKTN